jgi:parallel beta-helix repeat protein
MSLSKALLLLPALVLSAGSVRAATLCVASDGTYPCYTTISAAVAAAAPGDVIRVGPGTYFDSITIQKPLSLVTENAIIDASGQARGLYINGLNTPGLREVNIAGFTVRNARFEGILVANTSMVTISGTTVINNNTGLADGTCPGLEDFESGESNDCGEGIHLMGADHAVVINNTVQNNAGGILVSDDTAAAHDNLISFNMVNNNPYACGITLASHPAALIVQKIGPARGSARATAADTGADPGEDQFSFGVFHNTVYANRSRANGLANGGGSGVGIFASVEGAKAYSNTVVANLLTENGLPGVALHAHATDQVLNDNLVVGNTLINNGADTADAATPGPTGVNVYALTPMTGNMIIANQIQNERYDVAVQVPAPVQVQFNSLQGNGYGVANLGAGSVAAEQNFWSCPNGPTIQGSCSAVLGTDVVWEPWLQMPLSPQPSF